MERMILGPWRFWHDAEATRGAYRAMRPGMGKSDLCSCVPCKNFAAQKGTAYPQMLLDLFIRLGIDHTQEIEVSHYWLEEGHLYCGWFHFVGSDLEGERSGLTYSVAPNCEIFFRSDCAIFGDEPFMNLPTLQLEFSLVLPWVIEEAEEE